jgi:hypothetical protein
MSTKLIAARLALSLRTTCPPTVLRGGVTKVIYILGPEGNVVELIEFQCVVGSMRRPLLQPEQPGRHAGQR